MGQNLDLYKIKYKYLIYKIKYILYYYLSKHFNYKILFLLS